ncbi:MAG: lipid-A-disaccharide synthase [Nitrospirae bacterium]|nr:lipid-A-disaccharide synthase [Nitrospirota bacterium]MCL5978819.1 lipid-A-disaccharide synthase [Nitrospirota bacterium]
MLERVMIVSGESSGELYGALLAKALKAGNPGIDIIGVGGERMEASGVSLISRIAGSFGIIEALKTYGEIKRTFKKVASALKSFNPQVLVLIDYPDFNMRVAREAKRLGIKVLYYVSPQVWAWREGRVKTIGTMVDKMAVILPFEDEIYKNAGIPCEFVGHPIMDEIREVINEYGADLRSADIKAKVKEELGLTPDKPVITLMPGSRMHEIKKLIPVMADVIMTLKERYPDYQFAVPVAPNLSSKALSIINEELKTVSDRSLIITRNSIKTLLSSDIAVIASGTSALQAAFIGVPMVVVYKLSPLTYFIGRLIVKVRHISLANVLLDKSVRDDSGLRIKELLQDNADKDNIIEELTEIMKNIRYREEIAAQLNKVRDMFLNKQASLRVAEMVERLGA